MRGVKSPWQSGVQLRNFFELRETREVWIDIICLVTYQQVQKFGKDMGKTK